MKVKYAAQVMSRSVSLSLKYCRETLNLKEFRGSEATEEFLLRINDIFDLLNSRCKYSTSYYPMKNALSLENKDIWLPAFEKTSNYLLGLKNMKGECLVKYDSRKIGFLGILCNIAAIKYLFAQLVENGSMSYLCTYKLSQDPLEHFFGLIRTRFGANNNPTPYQFRNTFRKLLLGVTDSIVEFGNVVLQETSEFVALIPSVMDKVDYIYETYDFEELDVEKLKTYELSQFKSDIVDYIAGFVVKKLVAKSSCTSCIAALKGDQFDPNHALIRSRDLESKMIYPSQFVFNILLTAEKVLTVELEKNWLSRKYFFDFIQLQICTSFVSLHGHMFKGLDNHAYELLKQVVACYTSIRFKSFARQKNEEIRKKRLRSKLSRLVIFSHQ